MVNAQEIIKFDRTEEELQELVLFLIAVAGKKADTVAGNLERFLIFGRSCSPNKLTPFEVVKLYEIGAIQNSIVVPTKQKQLELREFTDLKSALKAFGFGCQTRLAKAFTEAANSKLNLNSCSRDDLLEIHGIGLKSANCFISWTRKGAKLAMLDTHLLAEMRDLKLTTNIPKSTPSSKKEYQRLEKVWLDYCVSLKVDPVVYDLEVWKRRSAPKVSSVGN